jgi:hypothetical protein
LGDVSIFDQDVDEKGALEIGSGLDFLHQGSRDARAGEKVGRGGRKLEIVVFHGLRRAGGSRVGGAAGMSTRMVCSRLRGRFFRGGKVANAWSDALAIFRAVLLSGPQGGV